MQTRLLADRVGVGVALLASLVLSSCVHARPTPLLPLTLIGDGGSWSGLITAEGIVVTSREGRILVREPGAFVVGRRNLLLNSELSGTSYISVLVDPADCMVDGRRYGWKAYVGVAVNQGEGDYILRGCAAPAGNAALPTETARPTSR